MQGVKILKTCQIMSFAMVSSLKYFLGFSIMRLKINLIDFLI